MTFYLELQTNWTFPMNQATQDTQQHKAIQDTASTNLLDNGISVITMIIKILE